jgi:mono/diheme cytochrome c family protein
VEKALRMRTLKILSIIAAVAFSIAGCGDSATTNQTANTTNTAQTASTPQPTPDAIAQARTTFSAECARCHGNNGDGGTATVLKKRIKVPSLKKGHALDHTADQMVKIITEGEDEMPPFKDKLKPEEIRNLVQFIRQELQGGAAKK